MAKKRFWRLRVTSDFCASHQLRHYEGKCENLHGHNFTVEAEVEGSSLHAKTGILMDFKILKSLLRDVLGGLDHRHLNELAPFEEQNPSSELLAQYIYQELAPLVGKHSVRLCNLSVSETESSKAVYWEE